MLGVSEIAGRGNRCDAAGIRSIRASGIVFVQGQVYPSYKIAVLAEELATQGIAAARLLEGTGVATDALQSPHARVSYEQVVACYRNAVRLSTDPALGLKAGERLRLSAYGMYGYALVASANLREALEFSIRYHELATPTVRMSLYLDDDDGIAVFAMENRLAEPALGPFNLELQFSLVQSLFRDMVSEEFRFSTIRAAYPEPAHRADYERLFACPLEFDCSANELCFDEWWLSRPLVRANPITAEMLREICDQQLSAMRAGSGVAGEIRALMNEDLRAACHIEPVARRLALSPRTLRRRLGEEGTSFQEILRDVRSELAIAYLRETRMTIDDIAERTGFSDAANFRHAFKRWTGKAPSAYRSR